MGSREIPAMARMVMMVMARSGGSERVSRPVLLRWLWVPSAGACAELRGRDAGSDGGVLSEDFLIGLSCTGRLV